MEFGIAFFGDGLEEGSADAVGGGVTVGVGFDGDACVKVRSVICEVLVEIVGVDGMGDVGRD